MNQMPNGEFWYFCTRLEKIYSCGFDPTKFGVWHSFWWYPHTLNRTFDELEVTAMGDSGHKFVKGLEASSVTIDFLNDTASANVLQTLQAAWGIVTGKQIGRAHV